MPEYIMHGKSIKALVDRGTVVIASGGGGIPVYNDENGDLEGINAVIDKNYSLAKMGRIIRANKFWIITNVKNVYFNFGSANQTSIKKINRNDLKKLYNNGEFQKGSIGPKIKPALHFLKYHG